VRKEVQINMSALDGLVITPEMAMVAAVLRDTPRARLTKLSSNSRLSTSARSMGQLQP